MHATRTTTSVLMAKLHKRGPRAGQNSGCWDERGEWFGTSDFGLEVYIGSDNGQRPPDKISNIQQTQTRPDTRTAKTGRQ